MQRYLFASVLLLPLSSMAQTPSPRDKMLGLMNSSAMCQPLKVSVSDFARLIGVPVPPGIGGDIGIDKDNHTITTFNVTDTAAQVAGQIRCQPSEESEILRLIGKKPEEAQLKDDYSCQAVIANRQVTSMTCSISGEIGRRLGAAWNFNGRMQNALQQTLN